MIYRIKYNLKHFVFITALLVFVILSGGCVGQWPESVNVNSYDQRINYLGNWESLKTAGQQQVKTTEKDGDFFEYSFLGTGIEVYADKSPQMGVMGIFLDGKLEKSVTCRAEKSEPSPLIYKSSDLPYGIHTIKGVKKSGPGISLRKFKVIGVRKYREKPGDTFADRAEKMKEAASYKFKNNLKLGLLYSAAYFDAGKDKDALELIQDFVNRISQSKKSGVNKAFAQWPIADVYFRYHDKLTPEMKNALKDRLLTEESYKWASTGNLFAMTVIPYYLAVEEFGPEAMSSRFESGSYHKESQKECKWAACRYWFRKGKDWSKFHDGKGRPVFLPLNGTDETIYDYIPGNDPTARQYIENVMINDVVKQGLMEYNCWPYGADNILPYLTLFENLKDRKLAKKAMMTYETILASAAPNWLGGHWAAAQGRSYPNTFNQRPFCGNEMFWPYFGGNPEARPASTHFPLFVIAARYRMPEYIAGAAQERSGEYVSKTNFLNRKQYTYMNKHYAVYSQFDKGVPTDFNPRFGVVPQSKRHGVVWEGVDGTTVLWINQPVYDGYGTSGYGTSDRVRFTQYKGTLVQTYFITEDEKYFDGKADYPNYPYAVASIPTNHLAVINEGDQGRIFLFYKHVMVAITSSKPFDWSLNPRKGKKGKPDSFAIEKIKGRKFGVVIETASPDEYPGKTPKEKLQAFSRDVIAKSKPEYNANTLSMKYTDRSGVEIVAGYDEFPSTINGGIVDKEEWPEIANPWMVQPWEGNLTIYDGPDKYIYDYKNWEIKSFPANEVN